MNDILVFSHMMKTAGTSLSKQLIAYFGRKMHIVPGGLDLGQDDYGSQELEEDLRKLGYKVRLIAGHPLRPYVDYGQWESHMRWFTFFREPTSRYVSHYFHDYARSDGFSYACHKRMRNDSIVEWEKFAKASNYQTKFIAGENSYDKAVEILETKFNWIGLTEDYDKSLRSFKSFFDLDGFSSDSKVANSGLSQRAVKARVFEKYGDFITEMNVTDTRLYDYIRKTIGPKLGASEMINEGITRSQSKLKSNFNTLAFYVNRNLKFRPTELNLKNIRRFYSRWYR